MVYATTFIELSSITLDAEGRDLIKETDERERERKRALSKLLGRVLRRMLHASISGTIALKGFRCPLPSLRGAPFWCQRQTPRDDIPARH